jgi:OHCU decarboxylase
MHFKGNFPESCSMEACQTAGSAADALVSPSQEWKQLLPRTKLKANYQSILNHLEDIGAATHVRFNIYPDGGVSRLRIFGRPLDPEDRVTGIDRFNRLSKPEARKALLDCCGSKRWGELMLKQAPFLDRATMLQAADAALATLIRNDWLEAFRHHPAIGAKRAKKDQSATARRWSAGEQSVAQKAAPDVLAALAAANQAYHSKFGHVFLICATGKNSEEILSNLQQRLSNDPDAELPIASEEQRKITRLRLEKLLAS